jgi:hypothetical protein
MRIAMILAAILFAAKLTLAESPQTPLLNKNKVGDTITDLLQLIFESYLISAHYKVQKKSWHYISCSLKLGYGLVV